MDMRVSDVKEKSSRRITAVGRQEQTIYVCHLNSSLKNAVGLPLSSDETMKLQEQHPARHVKKGEDTCGQHGSAETRKSSRAVSFFTDLDTGVLHWRP